MNASLYGLTGEFVELLDTVVASADEDGEVNLDLLNALAEKGERWEQKAISCVCVYRALDDESEIVEREIERLTAYKKRIDKARDNIKERLDVACQAVGVERVQGGMYGNISYRTSTQTVIENEDLLPEEYVTVKVTRSPNKTEIKKAIERGEDVPGARLEKRKNIQIK